METPDQTNEIRETASRAVTPGPASPPDILAGIKRIYTTTALVWLSTSVLAVVFIAASYFVVWIAGSRGHAPARPTYSSKARAAALESLSPADAKRLFLEFDGLNKAGAFLYRPWVGFSERTYSSDLLNIDDAYPLPIRRTIHSPDRAANRKTVWLFGGSTQFGWGVPDGQTIASHLSAMLSTDSTYYDVINHGHTYFYSSQESVLFTTLLRQGQKCDIAIFLDGLNDVAFGAPKDVPFFTDQTAAGFVKEQVSDVKSARQTLVAPFLPAVTILRRLLGLLSKKPVAVAPQPQPLRIAENILKTYRFNLSAVQALADGANVKVAFYWQPTPYDYLTDAEKCRRRSQPVFDEMPRLNSLVLQSVATKSFHFIADLFNNQAYDNLYVDDVHYGDTGSRAVAQAIAASLKKEGLLR